MTRPMEDEMVELFMAALHSGGEPNFNVILGSDRGVFRTHYKPQPELVRLLQANRERFIKLLEEPVIIAADWGFGAKYATFRVVPAEQGGKVSSEQPFVTFTLPFPPDKPYAVLQ